ncbi:MAG: hypothetical protein ACOYN0_20125 [Phycisphaerales bacterium]
MPPPPRSTHSGPMVLGVTFGLIFLIAFGVMGVALLTRRTPAPPPRARQDAPVQTLAPDAAVPRTVH